jgi:3-isopropylmalate/(R)-2-methylmalate dehydratase small subunit
MTGNRFVLNGRVAAVLGDNIDTDMIYPGRYLNITDREKTAEHLFELVWPDLRARIRPGDILVAGRNFGCGSSREQATAAVKYAGVGAVIAGSFARIFFRNSINLGLPLVCCPAAVQIIGEGDDIEIDLLTGAITNASKASRMQAAPLDARAAELLRAGGLVPYLKRKHASEGANA